MSCHLSNVKWAKGRIKKALVELVRWAVSLLSALIGVNFANRMQLPFSALKHEFLIIRGTQTNKISANTIYLAWVLNFKINGLSRGGVEWNTTHKESLKSILCGFLITRRA